MENNAINMFKKLKKHVGEDVSYEAWWYGSLFKESGKLEDVNYYSNVLIGDYGIPFIGYGSAIKTIILNETGEVLYHNPYIEDEYDLRRIEDIEKVEIKFFGPEYTFKKRNRRNRDKEDKDERARIADRKAKLKKRKLMKESITYVKEDLQEEWLMYVDKNTEDAYSCAIIEASIVCLKALSKGANYDNIINIIDECDLSGYMGDVTIGIISHFSPYSKQLVNNDFTHKLD